MSGNFTYSIRDHKFILNEWLNMAKVFGFDKYKDYYGPDDINVLLGQIFKIVADKVAPTNEDGDKIQARFDNGTVTIPASFHEAYRYLNREGWGISNLDEHTAGTLPRPLYAALTELITAANPAFIPYLNLSAGVSELIQSFGSEWAQATFLPRLYAGDWSGTMCLTEAGGGSDVGDILTRAYPTEEPGIYRIKGQKVFITAGDHDMCENIIHMTLARIEGGAPGTRGISLFIVPKVWVSQDGSLEKPNDVITVSIEHKMGLKGSSTAVLNFGENDECRGILIGNPPGADGSAQGMAQMFKMMNGARMDTGQAGYTLPSVAYFNAAEYARNRIQGRTYGSSDPARVPIIQHADVRRMLLTQKAVTEAMRAMVFQTYYCFDVMQNSPDEAERKTASDRIEIATPLVKAYCSDMAWPLIAEAIQVYGGYGYTEEYPLAQLARDCKIYSLWEGTNYIQAMDLVGRKWNLKQGRLFGDWLDELGALIESFQGNPVLSGEAAILKQAFAAYMDIQRQILTLKQSQPNLLPLYATRILHATAKIYCGALILDQAVLAASRTAAFGPNHYDYPFYTGKVESAKFFIHNIVPDVFTLKAILMNGDSSALDIPEASFGPG